MQNPLDSVVYISLPEGFSVPSNAFQVDVTVPLPVQKPAGNEPFDISTLSWEMILAGILTIMAYEKENVHLPYYRSLLLSVKPEIKKELTEAAILKARNEDYEIAEEIFSALRGLDPEDIGTIVNSALFYDERGSSYRTSGLTEDADACDDQAYAYYKQAMTAESPEPNAFFNAGFFFLKQKNFARAKDVFETYLTLTSAIDEKDLPENEKYKRERAKEVVQDISSRNLEDEQFKSAYDFISMGEEEKGLEQIHLFLEKNPKVWNAWFMLGWGLRRLERWEDAKAAFNQAIACGGENCDTFNELAICLLELGEFEQSKKLLARALQVEPENTKIMSNMGYVLMKSGNLPEAKKFFLAVLEFDPDDTLANQFLKEIEDMLDD